MDFRAFTSRCVCVRVYWSHFPIWNDNAHTDMRAPDVCWQSTHNYAHTLRLRKCEAVCSVLRRYEWTKNWWLSPGPVTTRLFVRTVRFRIDRPRVGRATHISFITISIHIYWYVSVYQSILAQKQGKSVRKSKEKNNSMNNTKTVCKKQASVKWKSDKLHRILIRHRFY